MKVKHYSTHSGVHKTDMELEIGTPQKHWRIPAAQEDQWITIGRQGIWTVQRRRGTSHASLSVIAFLPIAMALVAVVCALIVFALK